MATTRRCKYCRRLRSAKAGFYKRNGSKCKDCLRKYHAEKRAGRVPGRGVGRPKSATSAPEFGELQAYTPKTAAERERVKVEKLLISHALSCALAASR